MNRRHWLIAAISATGVVFAQKMGASEQDKFGVANQDVKELLFLMDTDKCGKVSKRDWMNFMEAEFNRLDKDGNGILDLTELRQSAVSVRRPKS